MWYSPRGNILKEFPVLWVEKKKCKKSLDKIRGGGNIKNMEGNKMKKKVAQPNEERLYKPGKELDLPDAVIDALKKDKLEGTAPHQVRGLVAETTHGIGQNTNIACEKLSDIKTDLALNKGVALSLAGCALLAGFGTDIASAMGVVEMSEFFNHSAEVLTKCFFGGATTAGLFGVLKKIEELSQKEKVRNHLVNAADYFRRIKKVDGVNDILENFINDIHGLHIKATKNQKMKPVKGLARDKTQEDLLKI